MPKVSPDETPAASPDPAEAPWQAPGQAPGQAPRRSLTPWLWGGGAVLALLAGGIAIATANAMVYSPEAQVQDYLDALAAGEGSTALALAAGAGPEDSERGADAGTPKLPPAAATSLLQGEPLRAGMTALGELTVDRGEDAPDGRSTQVTVAYAVDGQEHSTGFTVEHTGRDWLFFDRWRLAAVPVQTVRVAPANLPPEAASGPVTAVVNGVEAPLVPEDSEDTQDSGASTDSEAPEAPGQGFAVLPPLVVDAEYESTYLAADPTRLVVDQAAPAEPTEPVALELPLRYTDAVAGEVNRQLDAYLAGCTEQKVLQPSGCPLGYDTVNRIPPDSIQWSVSGDPEATVVPLPAEGEDPTVMEPLEAVAELTLQEIDLVSGEQQPVVHRAPFTLEADLAVTAESVRLTPRLP